MNRKNVLLESMQWVFDNEQALVTALTDAERQVAGTFERWSAKDLIAHTASWKEDMVWRLAGKDVADVEDFDVANAAIFDIFQNRSWEEVLAYAQQVHIDLMTAVAALEEDELGDDRYLGWKKGTPVWRSIAGYACLHPLTHLGEHYRQQGEAKPAVDLHEEALEVLGRLDDSPAWRGSLVYNLACQYALAGRKDEAIARLGEALQLHPALVGWSQQDGDLASLRDEPGYQALYVRND